MPDLFPGVTFGRGKRNVNGHTLNNFGMSRANDGVRAEMSKTAVPSLYVWDATGNIGWRQRSGRSARNMGIRRRRESIESVDRRVDNRGVGGGISGGRRKFRRRNQRMCDWDKMHLCHRICKEVGMWVVVRQQVRLTSPVGIGLDGWPCDGRPGQHKPRLWSFQQVCHQTRYKSLCSD
jgi:hypothetical protein